MKPFRELGPFLLEIEALCSYEVRHESAAKLERADLLAELVFVCIKFGKDVAE